jgi:RNA polymerase sigma-70 factor (ECF subfamily)
VTDELANEIQSGIMEEAEIEREERRQELRKKLRRLEPKYQEVLYLRYFEGLSVQEIAQRLNLPPRRVSERINYATKLLQKEFKKAEIFSIFPVVFLNIV